MKGLSIDFSGCISELLIPLQPAIDEYYWLIDSQGGITDNALLDNAEAYESMLVCPNVLPTIDLSMPIFKPYFITILSSIFKSDEWLLYIGIKASCDEEALYKAQEIDDCERYGTVFFRRLYKLRSPLILNIAGDRWEVYCSDDSVIIPFEENFATYPIDSQEEGVGRIR